MHSILGLAASELIASDASLTEAAMAHRLKSIQAIKRKLAASNSGITYAEGNALIATCFALTFQSIVLEDGSKQPQKYILCSSWKGIKRVILCSGWPIGYLYSFAI